MKRILLLISAMAILICIPSCVDKKNQKENANTETQTASDSSETTDRQAPTIELPEDSSFAAEKNEEAPTESSEKYKEKTDAPSKEKTIGKQESDVKTEKSSEKGVSLPEMPLE